jgi:2-haloacid dehalogenase
MVAAELQIKGLVFDVGGTVIDWHGTISQELAAFGRRKGVERDWAEATRAWRKRALEAVRALTPPTGKTNIDHIHRETLVSVLKELGIDGVTEVEQHQLVMGWHKLAAWSDAVEGHARLKRRFVVAALTILSTSLIIDVSRRAPFNWDCVISCEMLGRYKPDPLTYQRASELLAIPPQNLLFVAAHNLDLVAAKREGYRTAFIRRAAEQGSTVSSTPEPDLSVDIVAADLLDLAENLRA